MLKFFTATCQIGVTTQGNQVMSTGKGEVCLNTSLDELCKDYRT
jgi:uncharacterized protein (UPF0333 family)